MKKIPEGFKCTTCGTFHAYTAWVAAHSSDRLTHTCYCGAKHMILNHTATLISAGKLPKPIKSKAFLRNP